MSTAEQVRTHYAATGLVERIQAAPAEVAPEDATLEPEQLARLDQFHTRGLGATLDLARDAALQPSERVLDAGYGIGGPRFERRLV